MKSGLYRAEFATPLGAGTGVVILLNGLVKGGDSMMYYVGTYTMDGDNITVDLTTAAHSHPPGMKSVFGVENVNIALKGKFNGDNAQASGQAMGQNFSVNLSLISAG